MPQIASGSNLSEDSTLALWPVTLWKLSPHPHSPPALDGQPGWGGSLQSLHLPARAWPPPGREEEFSGEGFPAAPASGGPSPRPSGGLAGTAAPGSGGFGCAGRAGPRGGWVWVLRPPRSSRHAPLQAAAGRAGLGLRRGGGEPRGAPGAAPEVGEARGPGPAPGRAGPSRIHCKPSRGARAMVGGAQTGDESRAGRSLLVPPRGPGMAGVGVAG